jgi:hypothetical protein
MTEQFRPELFDVISLIDYSDIDKMMDINNEK